MKQGADQFRIVAGILLCCLLTASPTRAQIIPDTTLPNNSIVTPDGNISIILGGTKAGNNLFHSFVQFSIPTGKEAHFDNALDIQNIFSRVTGVSISNIDGLIKANGTANLFLINPNGIIFGPNASLNIGGSFLASTASSIRFADGTQFSATEPQTAPLLTVSVPIGLQFGMNPGTIRVQGPEQRFSQTLINLASSPPRDRKRSLEDTPEAIVTEALNQIDLVVKQLLVPVAGLQVQSGRTLALVGGDVLLERAIIAAGGEADQPGGRIELGSVTGGTVSIAPSANGWALGYEASPTGFKDIRLSQQSLIRSIGSGSGDIQVRGASVTIEGISGIFAATLGDLDGGEISIQSEQLNIEGNSILGAVTQGAGKSENITLEIGSLTVKSGFIGSLSSGQGNAGILTIEAKDSVTLLGTLFNGFLPSGIFGATGIGGGNGGNLTIQTRRLTIKDGSQIAVTTGGIGKAGTININAFESVNLIGESITGLFPSGIIVSSFGQGAAGDLTIETRQLTLENGSVVSAATRIGQGGTVTVKALDFVELRGTTANGEFPTDLSANTLGSGKAGDVRIETGQLIIRDGAEVTASTRGPQGTGAAGDLTVKADSIWLNNGRITAETKEGNFGNITLQTQDLQIRRNSQITTNATGSGGNIEIKTDTLVALENSDITANSVDRFGGRVIINAQGIFGTEFRESLTSASDITATSQRGQEFSGIVDIQTPDLDPTSGLLELPENFVDVAGLIDRRCSARNHQRSTFIDTQRGGKPPSPSEPLNSNIGWVDSRFSTPRSENYSLSPMSRSPRKSSTIEIVEAQGWKINAFGEVELTAEPSIATPYGFQSTLAVCHQQSD